MKPILLLLLASSLALSQTADQWKKKGDALDGTGKPKQAIQAYEKALAKDPTNSEILVQLTKQYGDLMPSLAKNEKKEAGKNP